MAGSRSETAPNLPSKRVIRWLSKLNVLVYRLSGGWLMNKMQGTPICLVTMTGRKSGRRITIPLMYNPDGANVILVASLGGAAQNPVWYYNLMAHPDVTIQVGTERRRMRARQADPAEKARLWPAIVANFPSYETYQRHTERDIPVIVCAPA